jgi:hypothetical protein
MADSITESEKNHNRQTILKTNVAVEQRPTLPMKKLSSPNPLIIWTPRFIVIFALLLVIGLSGASLLTQGWLNSYYLPFAPELLFDIFALGCWIVALFYARSPWVRLGVVFSIIWTLFSAANYSINLLIPVTQTWTLIAHVDGARNVSLLACFICLSIAHTPFTRWDAWFFRIAPVIGIVAVAFAQVHAPIELRTLAQFENHTTNIALYLCMCVWWLRPSCWKAQPALTFLLGINPIVQRILGIPFPHNGEPTLFFTLVLLLFFGLAGLHSVQRERQFVKIYGLHSQS